MVTSVYKEVEVDIADFDDLELLDELKHRHLGSNVDELNQIADAFGLKKNDQAMRMVEDLIYEVTGRIVPLV